MGRGSAASLSPLAGLAIAECHPRHSASLNRTLTEVRVLEQPNTNKKGFEPKLEAFSLFCGCLTRTRTQTNGGHDFLIKAIDFQRLMAIGFFGFFGNCYNFVSISRIYLLILAQNYPRVGLVPPSLCENTPILGHFYGF